MKINITNMSGAAARTSKLKEKIEQKIKILKSGKGV